MPKFEFEHIRMLFGNADSFLILGALIALYIVHQSRDTRMSNLSVVPWLLFWLLIAYTTYRLITGLIRYAASNLGEFRYCSTPITEDCTSIPVLRVFSALELIAPIVVLILTCYAAYYWRSRLRLKVNARLHADGILEPELTSTQQIVFLTGEKPKGLVAVHTQRGSYLSTDLVQFEEQPHGAVVLGPDGAIAIHVTHILDDKTKEANPVEQTDPPTLTIFPASEVEAIEVQH